MSGNPIPINKDGSIEYSSNNVELRSIETKLTSKVAESIEELASIIKDYAKKNRKLNDRVQDLEMKVFGHSKIGKKQTTTS